MSITAAATSPLSNASLLLAAAASRDLGDEAEVFEAVRRNHLDQRLVFDDENARRRRLGVEHVAQTIGESREREGFGDQLDARIKASIVDYGVAGVARRVENLDVGATPPRGLGELTPVHVRPAVRRR